MHDAKAPKPTLLRRLMVPPAKAVLGTLNGSIRAISHDPSFFDTGRFPWVADVEADFPAIREECLRSLANLNGIPNLEDLGDAGSAQLARGGDWKALLLMMFGRPIPANAAACPNTYAALQKIPGVQSALFSILAPHVHLARHTGPFAGVLRYHMGIIVPPGEGCRISVDDQIRQWHPGQSIIFDDTHPHEVWNDTDQLRVVLFVDFVRPTWWPVRAFIQALFAIGRNTPFAHTFIKNAQALATKNAGVAP